MWKQAQAAEALIPADRLAFYDYYVLTGIAINRDGNRMLLAGVGRHRGARESRRQGARRTSDVKEALAAIAEIKRMERAAEYGKWRTGIAANGWWGSTRPAR